MKKPDEILAEFNAKLASIPDKDQQIREIIGFAIIYGDSYGVKIIPLLERGISLSKETGFSSGEIICYYHLLFFKEMTQGSIKSRYLASMEDISEMAEKLRDDKEWYPLGLNLLAFFHWFRGEYEKGFNTIFEALKLCEEQKGLNLGWNYFGLAVFYFDTKDLENSEKYYNKSMEIFMINNHEYGVARASTSLGTIAVMQNRTKDAFPLLKNAADVYRKLGHYSGLSRALNDMGLLEKADKNYDKAVLFFNESVELRQEIGHIQGLITSCTELGETYLFMKKHQPALDQFKKALDLAREVKSLQKEMRLYMLLYTVNKELQNTEAALENFEKFYAIKSQLLSDEASNNIKRIQTKFEKEKSEKEAEIERLKNIELKKANAIIEQKNKDITDSINYAKRIQQGILPSEEILNKCFENYFVLYKPKDIVSGDFYWAVESVNRNTQEKLSVIAAVDCTGHGVPGAFMSMLSNTLLNQTIINPDVRTAADVLDYLNNKLPENLKSTTQDLNIRDGMDMALCIFDFKNMLLEFSGANNPCWIIRNGELIEVKGDKQAISASNETAKKKFSNHVIELHKNDRIYLLTDGYADQFGGPNEKKFTYKRLKELILENSTKPAAEQKEILERAFEHWRNDLEQIDDVCVIGIMV